MSKISVIIPVYNGEKFIARAIECVLNQTLPAYEIIVINDGSKDGTEKILEEYSDKIIFKTIPNGGVSNARNKGIELSTGDWIAFLDADDIWYSNKLQRQTEWLKKNPSVGLICCDYTIYNPVARKTVNHFSILINNPLARLDYPVKDSLKLLISENFIGSASNVMISREVLQKTGVFNINYRQAEDYDLWLRCAMHTEFLFMSEVLMDKDTHDNNLTNNQAETCRYHDQVLNKLLDEQKELLKKRNLINDVGWALAQKSYQAGNVLYDRQEISAAFAQYCKGLAYSKILKNLQVFLWVILKKSIRTISGGLISKKNLINQYNMKVSCHPHESGDPF